MLRHIRIALITALLVAAFAVMAATTPKKAHVVALGSWRQVPYTRTGDPAGAGPDESTLKTRPLVVDGRVSEWTTGEMHEITDRSFVVRRALRINDALPSDKPTTKAGEHWVWQRGPWLMVDKLTGHVTALKLPDYEPGVSQVAWFRDYAAYCGVTVTGKSLFAVVAQVGVKKPVLARKLAAYDAEDAKGPVCVSPEWQREPLKVTFHPAGRDAAAFDLEGGSARLVEDGEDETP